MKKSAKGQEKPTESPTANDDEFSRILASILDDKVLSKLQSLENFQPGAAKEILSAAIATSEAKLKAVHLIRVRAQCFSFIIVLSVLVFGFILLLCGKHTEGLTAIVASALGGGRIDSRKAVVEIAHKLRS